jgi:hypothetical protein
VKADRSIDEANAGEHHQQAIYQGKHCCIRQRSLPIAPQKSPGKDHHLWSESLVVGLSPSTQHPTDDDSDQHELYASTTTVIGFDIHHRLTDECSNVPGFIDDAVVTILSNPPPVQSIPS